MSVVDIGIRMSGMGETVSGPAKQVAGSLQEIVKAQEDIQKSFPKQEVQMWERLQTKMDQARSRQESMGAGAVQKRAGAGSGVNIDALMRRTGGTIGKLGKGDAIGGASDALGTLGGMLGKLGPAGAIAAGVGGTLFAGNMLSQQYEQVMQDMMGLAGVLGDLGTDVKSNSVAFKSAMKEASESAQEFGFSLKEGASIMRALSTEGVVREGIGGATAEIMAYARGKGVSPEALTRYQGMGRRFGMKGNLLGLGIGGTEMSEMGPGRFQEYLNATLGIFEEGISQGVVKGFSEISATQNFMAQIGEAWRGQLGAQRINQMSGAIKGATGLQSERDVIMFRAAQSLGGGGSYIDVMKRMEKGMTPDMFGAISKQIGTLTGGNRTDQIEMFKDVFGVNYTLAEDLYTLATTGKTSRATALIRDAPLTKDTAEIAVSRANEGLSQHMREIGSNLIGVKAAVVTGAENVVDAIAEFLMADVTAMERREQARKLRAKEVSRMKPMLGISGGKIGAGFPQQTQEFVESAMSGLDPLAMSMEEMGFSQFLSQSAQTPGGGNLFNMLAGLSGGTKSRLLRQSAFSQKLMPMLERFGESESEGGRKVTMSEFNKLIDELGKLVVAVDKNTQSSSTIMIKKGRGARGGGISE